jgi:hypothetical protein
MQAEMLIPSEAEGGVVVVVEARSHQSQALVAEVEEGHRFQNLIMGEVEADKIQAKEEEEEEEVRI